MNNEIDKIVDDFKEAEAKRIDKSVDAIHKEINGKINSFFEKWCIGCAVALLLCFSVSFVASGCKNSASTIAAKAAIATEVTVDGVMNGWGDWVRAGRATAGDEAAVKAVYEKYQATVRAAEALVKSSPSGSTNVMEQVSMMISGSRNELIDLVNKLRK